MPVAEEEDNQSPDLHGKQLPVVVLVDLEQEKDFLYQQLHTQSLWELVVGLMLMAIHQLFQLVHRQVEVEVVVLDLSRQGEVRRMQQVNLEDLVEEVVEYMVNSLQELEIVLHILHHKVILEEQFLAQEMDQD